MGLPQDRDPTQPRPSRIDILGIGLSVVRAFGPDRGIDQRRAGLDWALILGGELAVLLALLLDGLSLALFSAAR